MAAAVVTPCSHVTIAEVMTSPTCNVSLDVLTSRPVVNSSAYLLNNNFTQINVEEVVVEDVLQSYEVYFVYIYRVSYRSNLVVCPIRHKTEFVVEYGLGLD